MAVPTEYSVYTWGSGDILTAARMNNLETQYDLAVQIPNNTQYHGEDTGGNSFPLIGTNTGDDVVVGSNDADQDDTLIQSREDIILSTGNGHIVLMPNGIEVGRFQPGNVLKMVQPIEVERPSPQVILDRTSGQYSEMIVQASGTPVVSVGYDHTADDFIVRDDATGTPILTLKVDENWLYSDNEPRASSKLVTPQAITTATRTALIWDTNVYDNDSINDIGGSNPTRHTITEAGRYLISARVLFADAGGGGSRRYAVLQHSGAAGDFGLVDMEYGNGLLSFTMSAIMQFATSEYFELDVYHDKGSNLNVSGEIQVQRLLG